MLIRVLRPLSTGHKPGSPPVPASRFPDDVLAVLFEIRAVSIVTGPPLSQLPGWERRTETLAELKIETVEELVNADTTELATLLGQSERVIKHWQQAALQALLPGRGEREKKH